MADEAKMFSENPGFIVQLVVEVNYSTPSHACCMSCTVQ